MTPGRRLRVRVAASSRHRPFWLAVFLSVELVAWGCYLLAIRHRMVHLSSWHLLRQVPDGQLWAGGLAILVGLLGVCVALLNYKFPRMAMDIASAFLWASLSCLSNDGTHPGVTLYFAAIGGNAFDFCWLFYDHVRNR